MYLFLEYYFVLGYVLLINSMLWASFLPCSLFSDASSNIFLLRGGMSCWFVFKINVEILAPSGGFLKEIILVCSRCKLLPPSVHRAVYKLSCACVLLKKQGGEKLLFLFQRGDIGKPKTSKDYLAFCE